MYLYPGGPFSPDLLKVAVSSIPVKSCNDSYSDTVGKQLPKGIIGDSMICAGYPPGGRDTCGVRTFDIILYIRKQ